MAPTHSDRQRERERERERGSSCGLCVCVCVCVDVDGCSSGSGSIIIIVVIVVINVIVILTVGLTAAGDSRGHAVAAPPSVCDWECDRGARSSVCTAEPRGAVHPASAICIIARATRWEWGTIDIWILCSASAARHGC